MKNPIKISVLFLFMFVVITSCKKDTKSATTTSTSTTTTPTTPAGSTGTLKIRFNNVVNTDSLVFNKKYVNPNGDTFSVTKFNYYISNVVLTKDDNSQVTLNVYQIVKQSDDTSRTVKLSGVPTGSYKSLKFMLGVDSSKNCSGPHTGGLDFVYAQDMFWSWNQGYIFLKLEGTSPVSTISIIEYHIGGYMGAYKAQRSFDLSFNSATANVSGNTSPTVNLVVNVNELFKNPNMISFATDPSIVSPGPKTKIIADNYADMISFGSVKN